MIMIITPYGMARIASDLFQMADTFVSEGFPYARFYVFCASIEVAMKAAILAKNCTDEQKRYIEKDLRHDLCKVQAAFEKRYLPIWDKQDADAIRLINPLFRSKALEYFTMDILCTPRKDFPDIEQIAIAARKVHSFLQDHQQFRNI